MSGSARRRDDGWRRIALVLVALALLARVAIPSGWMPNAHAAGLTLKWCADAGGGATFAEASAVLAKATGKSSAPKAAHGSDQPCAFAAAALPLASSDPAPALAPAAAPRAANFVAFLTSPGRGLVAPPPFSTGPPLRA